MVEKIKTIKNPLTIIAIFAAIAEISSTGVLPFLTDVNQNIYIWFSMIFPIFLVTLFFLTLNFNHKVLYAPSDFQDEENFFKSIKSASPSDRANKLKEQVREIEEETREAPDLTSRTNTKNSYQTTDSSDKEPIIDSDTSNNHDEKHTSKTSGKNRRDIIAAHHIKVRELRARYSLAEELVLNKLSKEFAQPIRRDVKLGYGVFDGIIKVNGKFTAIEVKYFFTAGNLPSRIKDTVNKLTSYFESLPDNFKERFSLILVITFDNITTEREVLLEKLYAHSGITPYPLDIRLYALDELEKEINLD